MENKRTASDNSQTPHHQSKKIKITYQFQETPNFPEEIIFEILTRLPVKSLLRFKCVSKSWLSLISCPRFIKTHLEISTKDPTFSNHQILIANWCTPWNLKQCSVNSLIFEPCAADLFDINNPMELFPERAFWVVGSCNGLICLGARETLYLCNPATRMSTKLPSINTKKFFIKSCGFGYVESTDDYRFVVILVTSDEVRNSEPSQMHIYSLKTGSWKRIDDFKGGYPKSAYGVFASGKLHFRLSENALVPRWDIISIDLETEVNGIIEKPKLGESSYAFDFGVLGGCICVVSKIQSARVVDLWVLKEYGVKESWTKMFAIPYTRQAGGRLLLRPLFVLPNDRVVVTIAKGLGVYSVKDNSLRCFEVTPNLYPYVGFYVESLVSPK